MSAPPLPDPALHGPPLPEPPAAPRPAGVRPDLPAAAVVVAAVAALGVLVGWAWSRLAPAEAVRVDAGGAAVPLLGQSAHRFDAMAVFLLLGLGAGVLAGAAAWTLRRRRGPVLLLAVALGSLVGAWVALRTGVPLAGARYDPPGAGGTGLRAPVLESGWVVVAQPLAASLAYALAAACHGAPDLGRPVDRTVSGRPGRATPGVS